MEATFSDSLHCSTASTPSASAGKPHLQVSAGQMSWLSGLLRGCRYLFRRVFRRGGLRLIIFFIPLPDSLPFPHSSTFGFLFGQDDRLAGLHFAPTREIPPPPEDVFSPGQMFVSLKFWQAKDGAAEDMAEFDAID